MENIKSSVDRIAEELSEKFGSNLGSQEDESPKPARRLPRKEVRKAAKEAGTPAGTRWELVGPDGEIEAQAVYPAGLLIWIRQETTGWIESTAFSPVDFPIPASQVMVQGVGYFGRVDVERRDGGRLALVERA